MNAPLTESDESDVSDLRILIDKITRRKRWVAVGLILSTAAFTVSAFVLTPVYRASVVTVPASADKTSVSALTSVIDQLGGLAGLAGIADSATDIPTQEALAVLNSREFTERFILEKELMPRLFSSKWDSTLGEWKVSLENIPTPARAYGYFDTIRTVTHDRRTGLVTLRIDWTDRHEAALWANELIQRVNQEMRERSIRNAQASIEYLEQELSGTSAIATREAINRLIEAQLRQRMLANVSEEFAFRVVDPAMAPDADSPLRPQKLLLILLGPIVGLVFSVFAVLAADLVWSGNRKTL